MNPRSINPLRILLVDDQELFRDAIRVVLEIDERFKVIGEATNGNDAIFLAKKLRPELILMDLCMPGLSGIEATRRIHTNQPEIQILILTTIYEENSVLEVLRNGASGYALKSLSASELKAAILSTTQGQAYLHPTVARHLISEYRRLAPKLSKEDFFTSRMSDILSQRGRDILHHLVRGQSNKEIASSVGITEGTVKNHLTSIFLKFRVKDRTALALSARAMRLA